MPIFYLLQGLLQVKEGGGDGGSSGVVSTQVLAAAVSTTSPIDPGTPITYVWALKCCGTCSLQCNLPAATDTITARKQTSRRTSCLCSSSLLPSLSCARRYANDLDIAMDGTIYFTVRGARSGSCFLALLLKPPSPP